MRIYYINDKQETEGYFYEMLKIKIRQWVDFNMDKIIDRKYGVLHIEHKDFEASRVLKTLDMSFYIKLKNEETKNYYELCIRDLECDGKIEIGDYVTNTFRFEEVEE